MAKDSDEQNKIVRKIAQEFADTATDIIKVAAPVQTPLVNKIVVGALMLLVGGACGFILEQGFDEIEKNEQHIEKNYDAIVAHSAIIGHPPMQEKAENIENKIDDFKRDQKKHNAKMVDKLDTIKTTQATILSEIKKNGH